MPHDPAEESDRNPGVPQSKIEKCIQKDDKTRCKSGLGRSSIRPVVLRSELKELMPESEIDTEIGKCRPSHEGGSGKDCFMVGGKNRRQEDREKAGNSKKNAMEEA